jgi:hypothetical protein
MSWHSFISRTYRISLLGCFLAISGGFLIGYVLRDVIANEKGRKVEAAGAEASVRIRFLEETVSQLTNQRDDTRGEFERQAVDIKQTQRELQETKQALDRAKQTIANADVKNAPLYRDASKSRNHSVLSYPAPEMVAFRSKQREWRSRESDSQELRRNYAGLVRRLKLDESDTEYFFALLDEREKVAGVSRNINIDTNSSPEEISDQILHVKVAAEAMDEKIKTFLNAPDDFQSFKKWEDTKYQRALINGFKWAFDSFGEPLTQMQEDRLAELYGAAGKQDMQYTIEEVKKTADRSNKVTPSMEQAAKNLAEKSGERMDSLVLAQAASILSPSQHKIFGMALQAMREDIASIKGASK